MHGGSAKNWLAIALATLAVLPGFWLTMLAFVVGGFFLFLVFALAPFAAGFTVVAWVQHAPRLPGAVSVAIHVVVTVVLLIAVTPAGVFYLLPTALQTVAVALYDPGAWPKEA